MDFGLAPAIRAVLHEAVDRGDTGYVNPRDTGAYAAFAGFARDRWGWSPSAARMGVTADVSVVIVESLRRLIAPGEGVVIMPPIYPPFFALVPEAGGTVVEVPLRDDGDAYAMDLAGIDRALAAGARGVLLCNPHNPVGRLHTRDELAELSEIVARHGGFVVSDEIHAPLTHHGRTFTPYLSVSGAAREHGIVAASASKAFNLAGLKCGLFVAAGERMSRLISSLPEEVTFRAGLFGLIATRAGFAGGRDWLDATVAAIETNFALLEDQLAEKLPGVRLRAGGASYLAWLDMSALGWGDDPAAHALRAARVALTSGPTFGAPGARHARMNVACAPETILEAVDRLAAC
jgi:cystathionine beta-lyase